MTMRTAFALARLFLATVPLAAQAAYTDEPMDPEKAFPVTARLVAPAAASSPGGPRHGIDLEFRVPEGYYLYNGRFKVEVRPAGLPLGPLAVPPGLAKDDPFIGPAEIHKKDVTLHLPFTAAAAPGTYTLQVTAQGCAEDRVCYAPFTQSLRLAIPPGYAAGDSRLRSRP